MRWLKPFRFGVAAGAPGEIPTRARWQDVARKAEDLGYATLLAPDHLWIPFGIMASAEPRCSMLRSRIAPMVS